MRLIMPAHVDPNHPIATQEYAVYTPPIEDLINTIGGWINRMESGGYSFGPPRFGKSRAIKWFIRQALEERFNFSIPLVIWIRSTDMGVGEAEFWEELLKASEFSFPDGSRARRKSALREYAISRMIAIARSAQSNYVALVIDEAQDMTMKEWKWLLVLQNRLDFEGIRLSVFSIGTQQLGYQHDYFSKTGNAHISARFMVLHTRFHGIQDSASLEFVLSGYDTESEWPKGSGISYFRHFSPESYKKKHRLVHCTDSLWRAFHELVPQGRAVYHKHIAELGIPMKHIAQSVEEVLWRLAEGESWEDVTSYQSLLEIVATTGYTEHFEAIAKSV